VKKAILLLSIFFISSCAAPHKQYEFGKLGDYYWNNDALSDLPANLFKEEFTKIKGSCDVEVEKLPIPSPTCVLPAKNECSLMTATGLGMCYSAPVMKCDTRAVNVAKKDREGIFSRCMQKHDWQLEWKPGIGDDISGGIFEYVAADKDNEYFIKLDSPSHIGSKYTAVLRIKSKENTTKPSQGVYVFDVENNTLQVDNTEPVLINKGSAADTLLTIIKQMI